MNQGGYEDRSFTFFGTRAHYLGERIFLVKCQMVLYGPSLFHGIECVPLLCCIIMMYPCTGEMRTYIVSYQASRAMDSGGQAMTVAVTVSWVA